MNEAVQYSNGEYFTKLQNFLNDFPDIFTEEIFGRYKKDEDAETMYRAALLGAIELYDEEPWSEYVEKGVHIFQEKEFSENFFVKNFKVGKDIKKGKMTLTQKNIKAFEGFAAGNDRNEMDGKIIPQTGFCRKGFSYPCIAEGREIVAAASPDEILKTKKALEKAAGEVSVDGLGIGYFAVMAAAKPEVTAVKVKESDKNLIALCREYVFSAFSKDIISKIEIVAE